VQLDVPMPVLAAAIAVFMELPVAFAVAVGAFARLSALLLVLYTLGTALIGHHYWTVKSADYVDSMDSFYKNLSIMGGFTSPVPGDIRSMYCAASPGHNVCATEQTTQRNPRRTRVNCVRPLIDLLGAAGIH
jgi:hypothetical protein